MRCILSHPIHRVVAATQAHPITLHRTGLEKLMNPVFLCIFDIYFILYKTELSQAISTDYFFSKCTSLPGY